MINRVNPILEYPKIGYTDLTQKPDEVMMKGLEHIIVRPLCILLMVVVFFLIPPEGYANQREIVTESGHPTGFYLEDDTPNIPRQVTFQGTTTTAMPAIPRNPSDFGARGEALQRSGEILQNSLNNAYYASRAFDQAGRVTDNDAMVKSVDTKSWKKFDKHTRFDIRNFPNGFEVRLKCSKYQFVPDRRAIVANCKIMIMNIAATFAGSTNRKDMTIDTRRIEVYTRRNILIGVTSCLAILRVVKNENPYGASNASSNAV